MFSLIIPVYRNEESLLDLLGELRGIAEKIDDEMEAVFVIDGSPDGSVEVLKKNLPGMPFHAQLILHSRNFGSFAAIRTGLKHAKGNFFGIMAADLQEPPELIVNMYETLKQGADVVVGTRERRSDPFLHRAMAGIFWWGYRRWVQPEMPEGGVDIFACNKTIRDQLLDLNESNSTLVGLLFWLGYNRRQISYARRPRVHGQSAWSFRRKVRYMFDSVFAFSDFPIQLMLFLGLMGFFGSLILGFIVMAAKLNGRIPVPGYAATVLLVLFFGGLNSFGLGVIGLYVWRTFENTKKRPPACVLSKTDYGEGPS